MFIIELRQWPATPLMQRFLLTNMLQEARLLVTQVSQSLGKDKLEFEIRFFKAIRKCHNIYSATEKVNYYVYGQKPSRPKGILEELRFMPSNVRSSFIDIQRIAAAAICLMKAAAKVCSL